MSPSVRAPACCGRPTADSAVAEAASAGLYYNAQSIIPICHLLQALNNPQPSTPIKTDNSTASAFVYDKINKKCLKSWDMRYYWLRDRKIQKQLVIYWKPGSESEADYFT